MDVVGGRGDKTAPYASIMKARQGVSFSCENPSLSDGRRTDEVGMIASQFACKLHVVRRIDVLPERMSARREVFARTPDDS